MVAVLVRLRFRVLATTLARNTWQLIAVILGSLPVLPILTWCYLGAVFAVGAGVVPIRLAVVLVGSAIVLGWGCVPLIFNGVEQTLDPVRLAPFPIPPRAMLAAGMIIGVTWIPGATTLLAGLASVVAWRTEPIAAVVALPSALLGTATAIALSRAVATITGNLIAGRAAAVRVAVVAALVVVVAGPAIGSVAAGMLGPRSSSLDVAADVLSWSPLGASWAVPSWIALGRPDAALGAAAVAIASLALVLVVWRGALGASLTRRGGGGSRARRRGGLGLLGRLPATPTGAIAARSLFYWFRDVRLARQLIMLPLMPVLCILWARVTGAEGFAVAGAAFTASLLPLAVFSGLSYDGTAFALQLSAGVAGVHDRVGRAAALLAIAVPAIVVVDLILAAAESLWTELPAMLGMTLGILLAATGVVSVSSARVVVPVPRPGRNPFSAPTGAAATSIGASYAVAGITTAVALPALVTAIIALVVGSALLGWIALAVGLATGAAVLVIGIRLGGSILDSRGPEVLSRLRLLRS